ncbi:hypothetical protein SELMODRAFT_417948 [Selaginella moellendorffii]|uniref:Uncharacterized protein n=1 Tax=Selaginella moellendorffii TaxID=88036 RepID=D8S464_SELML|nr:hypothetical protein SELMODRAFT_417948 [Selaginella moellendorffii]
MVCDIGEIDIEPEPVTNQPQGWRLEPHVTAIEGFNLEISVQGLKAGTVGNLVESRERGAMMSLESQLLPFRGFCVLSRLAARGRGKKMIWNGIAKDAWKCSLRLLTQGNAA